MLLWMSLKIYSNDVCCMLIAYALICCVLSSEALRKLRPLGWHAISGPTSLQEPCITGMHSSAHCSCIISTAMCLIVSCTMHALHDLCHPTPYMHDRH